VTEEILERGGLAAEGPRERVAFIAVAGTFEQEVVHRLLRESA